MLDEFEKLPTKPGLAFGLDIGIASCGWAVLLGSTILNAGVWAFEVPEVPKTRESRAKGRRESRGQRRVIRRRRQRLRDVRRLLFEAGMLSQARPPRDEKGASKPHLDPWLLRAEGLSRLLTEEEFATVLIHIAKHRGFWSNSKADRSNEAPDESKKLLSGADEIRKAQASYSTVGEMFAKDPRFADRKRNRDGDYSHTILRELNKKEVAILFERQRQRGSDLASDDLEARYTETAFFQRELQDSEKLLGHCPFEPQEKRASANAYSFELFRYVSKLNTMRVKTGKPGGEPLSAAQLSAAVQGFGQRPNITFKGLKTLIGLPKTAEFIGVGEKDEARDVARNSKGCAYGSATLRAVLGEAGWKTLVRTPEKLDAIARVLTFREALSRIREGLEELDLDPLLLKTLMEAVEGGAFSGFSKAGHISTLAARNMLPHLLKAQVYSEAAAQAGYDHAAERPIDIESITSPVARRAITQTLKQVKVLMQEYGKPDIINIELLREMGKGPEERGKMTKGIERRTREREAARERFAELLNRKPQQDELLKFELWVEQRHQCLFCGDGIGPEDLLHGAHKTEVEHILPLSRSHDNSYHNKVVAHTGCNREKKNQTPYEWFGKSDPERWHEFEIRVKTLKNDRQIKGLKTRNLLMQDFEERELEFLNRNQNDASYAARVVMSEIKKAYPSGKGQKIHVFARPGALTAELRRQWGLQGLKYLDRDTRIEDERHHAIDAIVVAASTNSMLQALTRAYQERERSGSHRDALKLEPPWPDFRRDAEAARKDLHVARSEIRRARGAGHAETVRSVRREEGDDGQVRRIVYERLAIDKLTKAKLAQIKDPDRNGAIVEVLERWLDAGKPADQPPLHPSGDPIRKVRVRSEKNPLTERAGIEVRHGHVDNGEIVRTDVFSKDGKFYLVPIYTHQVADRQGWPTPPKRAINAGKPESEWVEITADFDFLFSLTPFSYVEVVNSKGEIIEGYYRGVDRSTGAVTLSQANCRRKLIRGIGARSLKSFRKYSVDRLGRRHPVRREERTWHGAVCT